MKNDNATVRYRFIDDDDKDDEILMSRFFIKRIEGMKAIRLDKQYLKRLWMNRLLIRLYFWSSISVYGKSRRPWPAFWLHHQLLAHICTCIKWNIFMKQRLIETFSLKQRLIEQWMKQRLIETSSLKQLLIEQLMKQWMNETMIETSSWNNDWLKHLHETMIETSSWNNDWLNN